MCKDDFVPESASFSGEQRILGPMRTRSISQQQSYCGERGYITGRRDPLTCLSVQPNMLAK
jgi:hypothetical protein